MKGLRQDRGRPRDLLDQGQIEENAPEPFFNNPQSERTQLFLSQIQGINAAHPHCIGVTGLAGSADVEVDMIAWIPPKEGA